MPKRTLRPKTREQLQAEIDLLRSKLAQFENGDLRESVEQPQVDDENTYRILFEEAKDGIILVDAMTGEIKHINRAFEQMTGHSADELIGRPLWEIEPMQATDAGLVVVRELRSTDHIFYDDLPLLCKDGCRSSVELACAAHSVNNSRTIECTYRDISRRKSIEDELRRSEARFRALFLHAHIGIAFVDQSGRIIDNNRALEEMLGYAENDFNGKHYGSLIHDEDRGVDARKFDEIVEGSRNAYQLTTRHLRKDGTVAWCLAGVFVIRDGDSRAALIIRIIEDITERKQAEETITRSRDFYRTLLNELPNPIRLTDSTGTADYFNRAWRSFTGRRREREMGDGWTESIHPEDRDRVLEILNGAIADRAVYQHEYRLRRGEGDYHWIVEFGNPFQDMNGQYAGYVSSCYDIDARKSLEETLRSISITDEMTGLLNRRGFFTFAQQQIKLANRSKRGLLLLFGDLDGLKAINDTYGHQAGDKALNETAALLREAFRESDIIARLGGDEFAVLMPEDAGKGGAEAIRGRLQAAIDKRNEQSPEPYDLVISRGVMRYDPEHPVSLDRLLSDADGLMYREKKERKQK